MDKYLVIGAALGIGLASASGVYAGYQLLKSEDPPAITRSAPVQVAPAREAVQPGATTAEACGPGEAAGAPADREGSERFRESRAERDC